MNDNPVETNFGATKEEIQSGWNQAGSLYIDADGNVFTASQFNGQ